MRWTCADRRVQRGSRAFGPVQGRHRGSRRMNGGTGLNRCCRSVSAGPVSRPRPCSTGKCCAGSCTPCAPGPSASTCRKTMPVRDWWDPPPGVPRRVKDQRGSLRPNEITEWPSIHHSRGQDPDPRQSPTSAARRPPRTGKTVSPDRERLRGWAVTSKLEWQAERPGLTASVRDSAARGFEGRR